MLIRVASCQLPDVRDDVVRATGIVRDFGENADEAGADLLCFPECFLQGYFADRESVQRLAIDIESPSFDRWLERVRGIEATLVLGLIEVSNTRFFNSAVVIRKGILVSRYRKIHLLDAEKAVFSAGEGSSVFRVNDTNVGVAICHDLNFAAAVNGNAGNGAQLIACPCNNMMQRATAEKLKDEHTAIRRKRAMEAGVWLLSSDVTGQREGRISYGPTSLIRHDGVVLDQVPSGETGMIVGDVE